MKIALYEENGYVVTVHPAPALFDETSRDRVELSEVGITFQNDEEIYNFIFSKDIPQGKSAIFMLDSELPEQTFRDAWKIVDGSLSIDLDKAKEITHAKRRESRALEFAPHDKVVGLHIPGTDTQTAESERMLIRAKYDIIQQDINNCSDVDSLKVIYDQLGG